MYRDTPDFLVISNKGFEFLSGGGGLVFTAGDYANFCQMIVNGGKFRGKRILKSETIALMLTDQLHGAGGPFRFGLGFAISTVKVGADKAQREFLEYSWGGYASTSFRIVPEAKLFQIVLRQHIPPVTTLNDQLIGRVYSGIALSLEKDKL